MHREGRAYGSIMHVAISIRCSMYNYFSFVLKNVKIIFLSLNESSVFQGGSECLGKVLPFVGVCSSILEINLVSF